MNVQPKQFIPQDDIPSSSPRRGKTKGAESLEETIPVQHEKEIKPLYSIVCPITAEIMIDPVIDEDGHTYENKAITTWLLDHTTCPLSKREISSKNLRPNLAIKDTIEWYRSQGFAITPTANDNDNVPRPHVKTANDKAAQLLIKGAQEQEDQGNFKDAEDLYITALGHTRKSEDYAHLPPLIEKLGEKERAASAYLVLADLQLNEGKLAEEIASLEKSNSLHPSPAVVERLGNALEKNGQAQEAAKLYLELCQQAYYNDDRINATHFCCQSLNVCPSNKEAWKIKSALQNESSESLKILLRGANEQALPIKERIELCKMAVMKDPAHTDPKFLLVELYELKRKEKSKCIKKRFEHLEVEIQQSRQSFGEQTRIFEELKSRHSQENSKLEEELRQTKLQNFQLTETIAVLQLSMKQLTDEVKLINSQLSK